VEEHARTDEVTWDRARERALAVGFALAVGAGVWGLARWSGLLALGCAALAGGGLLLVGHPEVFLSLYVFAGIFKGHPLLALPSGFDWTMMLGVAAVFAIVLRATIVAKLRLLRVQAADLFLGGLLLVLLLGLLYSRDVEYGLSEWLELATLGALAAYALPRVIALVSNPNRVGMNVLRTVFGLGLGLSAAVLLGFGASARSFAGNYLSWGTFQGVASVAAAGLVHLARRRTTKCLIVGLIPVLLAGMVLARARGPLISLAGVAMLWLLARGRTSRWRKAAVVAVLVAIIGGIFALNPSAWWRYSLLFSVDKGTSIDVRVEAYRLAGALFLRHPIIGAGTGSFRHYASGVSGSGLSYPHNAILHVLSENGVLGGVFYGGWLVALFMLYLRGVRNRGVSEERRQLLHVSFLVFMFLLVGSQLSGGIMGRAQLFFGGLVVLLASSPETRVPASPGVASCNGRLKQ